MCGGLSFFCLYAAKILLSFCRLFLSFYNERQRLTVWGVAAKGQLPVKVYRIHLLLQMFG